MGDLARFDLPALARTFSCAVFFETGTGSGAGVRRAAKTGAFSRLFTVECFPEVAAKAGRALANDPRIRLIGDTSEAALDDILPRLPADAPVLFWLDAHFPGADFGYAAYDGERDDARRLPLERELRRIRALRPHGGDVILIDDLRIYEDGPFGNGPMPDFAQTLPPERRHTRFVSELFGQTHHIHRLYQEEGYMMLLPRRVADGAAPDPFVCAHLRVASMGGQQTMQECGKAALRRLHQPNYATRYFVGHGIDIGGGDDPLSLYTELFPRIASVTDWDWEQGDAQALYGVADDRFDFVHSSHCLEHLQDPREGLKRWFQVLRPGGHMVLTVPDEDLYEQGVFPSRYNGDHKWTFTILKHRSWSERSLNLIDLVRDLGPAAEVKGLTLLDGGYRYAMPEGDQTLTTPGECAIELVIRKRPAAEVEAGGRLPRAEAAPSGGATGGDAGDPEDLAARLEASERLRQDMQASLSWRVTAPLRRIRGGLRRRRDRDGDADADADGNADGNAGGPEGGTGAA
jgi:hypothetical protein